MTKNNFHFVPASNFHVEIGSHQLSAAVWQRQKPAKFFECIATGLSQCNRFGHSSQVLEENGTTP